MEEKLMGLLSMGIGGLFFLWTAKGHLKPLATLKWPSVQGEIIDSKVESYKIGGDRPTQRYGVSLEYEYEIKGQSFTGSSYSYGPDGPDPIVDETGYVDTETEATAFLPQYPKGKTVTVYYNPDNPREACLLVGGYNPWIFYVFAGIFLIIGSMLFFTGSLPFWKVHFQ